MLPFFARHKPAKQPTPPATHYFRSELLEGPVVQTEIGMLYMISVTDCSGVEHRFVVDDPDEALALASVFEACGTLAVVTDAPMAPQHVAA